MRMNNSKITVDFDMSQIDKENKFLEIEAFIREFLVQYFPKFEIRENIKIILAKNVGKTKAKITGNKKDVIDKSLASVIYFGGQFVIVFAMSEFKPEMFPQKTESHSKESLKDIRLPIKHLIYHEIQHIKNRYDYPILAKKLDNHSNIPDIHNYFKLSAYKFIDEYLATVNSQSLFGTETDHTILDQFKDLHEKMGSKFLEKKITHEDVSKIAYFYSHVFAINKIRLMKNLDELSPKIENRLNDIEKKFYVNINNVTKTYLDKDIKLDKDIESFVSKITTIMTTFYKIASNRKNL